MRKVVVTGLGIVSCIGNNKDEVLKSLLNTKSGIVFSEDQKKYNFRKIFKISTNKYQSNE